MLRQSLKQNLFSKIAIFTIIVNFTFGGILGNAYAAMQDKLRPGATENGNKTTLFNEYTPGLGNFKLGVEPSEPIADTLTSQASVFTSVVLTALDLRGRALGLTNKSEIGEIKNTADGTAKRIYQEVANREGKILLVRVSEGIGRDEVAESFDANDIIVPDALSGELKEIKAAIDNGATSYKSPSTKLAYEISDAIVDVVEGTNAFVTNVGGKPFGKIAPLESGGTSIIAVGPGVRSTGNCPDIYADGIITVVPQEERQNFVKNPLDPETTAADPSKIKVILARIAQANKITINDLEVVLMDRSREGARLTVLKGIKKEYSGLEIVQIKDGTVAHNIEAMFGRNQGKHKVVMTVGGSPEWFFNNDVTSIFKEEGALSSIRLYSKNVNKTGDGQEAVDLSARYAFDDKEKAEILKLRPADGADIIAGKKLLTQEDVTGDVEASIAFITHNGVLGVKGVEKLEDGNYKVSILRIAKINGKPSRWIEERIISEEKLAGLLANEVDTVLANLDEKEPLINAQTAVTGLIEQRDRDYMKSVNSVGTAKISTPEVFEFMPGHDGYEALRRNRQAVIAVNVVSYNQIEGHIRAAMKQDALLILEVARSQLGYALDENTVMRYVREIVNKTGSTIPIIVHGDHIQYAEIKPTEILKKVYEARNGEGSFKKDMDVNAIDAAILKEVQQKLKEAFAKERAAITAINERLIKAGFTSIAVDASTVFNEAGGDAVLDYYSKHGTAAEKLVVRLENDFALALEWGVDFLKLNPNSDTGKKRFEEIKTKVVSDMKMRGRPQGEIDSWIAEMEAAFGILVKEARKNKLEPQHVISSYDRIMEEVEAAKIAGKIPQAILNAMSENEKLLLLPTSNVEETAYQIYKIDEMVAKHAPKLKGRFGKEVEVGHVDRKAPNPRHGGKMEAKMTHPAAVKLMGEHLKRLRLDFDLIATNNGSGHGTEFDLETLTPVSQVGKISPWLTAELQREAEKFSASIAQHGTSGSDMDELTDLANAGVIKFNIATNYQQILLNVLSLLDDGLKGEKLIERIGSDSDALMAGLHEDTRAKIMRVAEQLKNGSLSESEAYADSLFMKFMKKTYAWGKKKEKVDDASSKEDIAKALAKEFKRVFGEMDKGLFDLGRFVQVNISMLDAMAYSVSPEGSEKFLKLVSDNKDKIFIIKADVIFDSKNTGILAVLKKAKQDFPDIGILVRADNKFDAYKLRLIGVAEIAVIVDSKEEAGAIIASTSYAGRLSIVVDSEVFAASSTATGKLAKIQKARRQLAERI